MQPSRKPRLGKNDGTRDGGNEGMERWEAAKGHRGGDDEGVGRAMD